MNILGRYFRTLAAVVLAFVATFSLTTAPANADAMGCTLVSGAAGANQCLKVFGTGLRVDGERESYAASGYAPENVCNYQARWNAWKQGTSGYVMKYSSITSSCNYMYASKTSTMHSGYYVHNSRFCGWWKSSNTDYVWSNAACLSITR